MLGSIRRSLTFAFIGLSVIPLVTFGSLIGRQSFLVQERQSLAAQRESARYASEILKLFFMELENELRLLADVQGLQRLAQGRQRTVMSSLLAYQHAFEELSLLDREGIARVRVSRQRFVPTQSFQRDSSEAFTVPMNDARTYFSPIAIDETTGEPFLTMGVPLLDKRTGSVSGVLSARVRIKAVWELIEAMRMGPGQDLYVVDASGAVVANRNPSIVLKGTRFAVPSRDGIAYGLSGGRVVLASDRLVFGAQEFRVVSEQVVREAFSLGIDAIRLAIALTVGALAMSFILGWLAVRSLADPLHTMADTARAISAGDLSQRVRVAARNELGVLADAFNSMTAQLQGMIGDLERRVAERTAQLEASNNELEAFSYSVSHDLRAPLRAMDGFTRMLLSDQSSSLSPETRQRLTIIQESSLQMGQLIEALLAFSRLGRRPLIKQNTDMAALASQTVGELRRELGQRDVEFVIGDIPPCNGDPLLLRQVWVNLLANAVKFTATREQARIEVGASVSDRSGCVYFVRDNGVGFDMRYADKLFRVFQRLHSDAEFEGTGIGLATVQRIVNRHGGRIWAEAQIDKGAVFFFRV